jgi:hypothetical protein
VINTNVTYFLHWRSCPYDRHDLYLPSVPASLQTLGRGECVAAGAPASHGLRIISPLPAYLNSLRAIWTVDKKFGSELSFHPSTVASWSLPDSRPPPHRTYLYVPPPVCMNVYVYTLFFFFFFSPEFARLQSPPPFFFPPPLFFSCFFFPRVCQTPGPSNSPPRMSRGGPRHLLHHASASGCHTLCRSSFTIFSVN